MRLLLDTHVFLWALMDDPKLSRIAREAFLHPANDLLLSVASTWEIAIKASLGKLDMPKPLGRFLRQQLERNTISLLPIELNHAVRVATLPFHHRDPFDRLLLAQSLEEQLPILSADTALDAYEVQRLW